MNPEATFAPELRAELERALATLGCDYRPRTRHVDAAGSPKYVNRLLLEGSPYLRQHAHNPVNWFPWGDEAFALAQQLARPVFLSVGYATCHWCHVMEEESFEDEAIATLLNERYVCIKLDREERPDVDAIYMTAVTLLSGRGGWPMSVWLTPEREPFFAGTYFPPRDGDRGMRRGFLTLLDELAEVFEREPGKVREAGTELCEQIRKAVAAPRPGAVDGARCLEQALEYAARTYDSRFGGVARTPKFPSSFPVRLLLRDFAASGRETSRAMAETTLCRMAEGGLYDQVGGGFHRYSTDPRWLVPHFEKMSYDNALLARAYLDAAQLGADGSFERIVRETLDYVIRELTAEAGAFYSASDADSLTPSGRAEEGYFFTWTAEELRAVLGEEMSRSVEAFFAVTAGGNFEGRSILHRPRSTAAVATELGLSEAALERHLTDARPLLLKARGLRPAPLRDDKIQTDWNGLMISAMARAGLVLGEPRYTDHAARAAHFLLSELRPEGRLKHSAVLDKLGHDAFLSDYAFLTAGLLDLFEATSTPRWLEAALACLEQLELYFADAASGGYFTTHSAQDALLAREKPSHDGAIPNGNSLTVMNQARAYALTGDDTWRLRAEKTLAAFATTLADAPSALYEMLLGVDFLLTDPLQLAIVLPANSTSPASALLDVWRSTFVPNQVLIVTTEGSTPAELLRLVPWLEGKTAAGTHAQAYLCRQGRCELPTSDPEVFRAQLLRARQR